MRRTSGKAPAFGSGADLRFECILRMETVMNKRQLRLRDHELLLLRDARGSTLQVTRGTVWITQHEDRSDVVLNAGDAWTLEQYGLTVVEARGSAEITVVGNAAIDTRVRSNRERWLARISRWIERTGDRHLRPRWVPRV
jgi:hypothetical protein